MERSKSFLAGLVALCFLAGHAFVHGRFGPMAKPAEAAHEAGDAPQFSHLFTATTWLWCGTQALSAGAALGLVLALTQAPVRADDMSLMDLESQVTVARIDKEQKKKELQADGLAVSQYTKEKVRTGEDKLREFTRDASLEFASTERSLRAGPGVRSVKRKSLQKEPSQGISFAGVGALASLLPALPSLPSLPLPSLPSGGPPSVGEDAALPLISGAAVSLALPAVVVAGAVNSRISEKKREDAERKARERADPTGSILTIAAGVGAAAILGNAILTSLPQGKEATKAPPVVTAAKPSADDGAAKKAAEDKAAAESKAAAEKAAADKAEADKAAAEKAAAEKKAAEDKAAADSKAAADKAAADKAAADKAAADKAAADKAEADKAAADKAEADKKAAESKAAADKAAADKAAAEKAAADQAAAEKAAEEKKAAEAPKAEESKQAKIAKKGGYFAYMKAKQQG